MDFLISVGAVGSSSCCIASSASLLGRFHKNLCKYPFVLIFYFLSLSNMTFAHSSTEFNICVMCCATEFSVRTGKNHLLFNTDTHTKYTAQTL